MAGKVAPNIITSGLVLYLDAANPESYVSGSTAWNDISRGGNNGTLVNGPTFSSANGGSIVFDGMNGWVGTNYSLINGTDASRPIALSFWINPDLIQPAVTNNPILIGSAYYSGFGLQYTGSVYRIWLRLTGGTYSNTLSLTRESFQYVNLIWGGIENPVLTSYINGTLNSQQSIPYSEFNQNLSSRPLRIALPQISGGAASSGYFKGQVSVLSVYHRVLSVEEILQNYNATKTRFGL